MSAKAVANRAIARSLSKPNQWALTSHQLIYHADSCNTKPISRRPNTTYICLPCRLNASVATAAPLQSDFQSLAPSVDTPAAADSPVPYAIHGSLLLTRAPLLTPPLSPFESSYYLYQRRLNERLTLPFSQYFYYKRGTPAFEEWRAQRRARGGVAARDIGQYNAYTKESWNDEILLGDKASEETEIVKRLIQDEGEGNKLGDREREVLSEEGEAHTGKDEMGGLIRDLGKEKDLRSLERKLERTLYLVVRRGDKSLSGVGERTRWVFPSAELLEREGVKEAAVRALTATLGPNMNTWVVAPHPIGHYIHHNPGRTETSTSQAAPAASEKIGTKHFFIKGRILAGQAEVIPGNFAGIDDYRWLCKEEVEDTVRKGYWSSVKNMLVEQ